ncbi:hypothetical protein GCM10023334_077680 [Nonomuraea thailandensis]
MPPACDIPDDVFTALARGAGGYRAARRLTAVETSKTLLFLRGVVLESEAARHPEAEAAARAYDLLASIQHISPGAVEAVLAYPTTGAWARSTVLALRDVHPFRAHPGQLAALAAAAAIRAGSRHSIPVVAHGRVLTLPSLGQARLSTDRSALPMRYEVTIRTGPSGAEIIGRHGQVRLPSLSHRDADDWRGLRRLSASADGASLTVTLDDLDPHRLSDQTDFSERVSPAELTLWQSRLEASWTILVRHHWTTAAELQAVLRTLIPLRPLPQGQRSGTDPRLFGASVLSLPPNALSFALTLAHELQHAKLVALLDALPLMDPEDERRYYAPWRDDPRPLGGLLQGVYAHLGVSGFWRRQRWQESGQAAAHAHAQFARWRMAALSGARTCTAADGVTPSGRRFLATLTRTLRAWNREWVPEPALDRARREAWHHLMTWLARNSATSAARHSPGD